MCLQRCTNTNRKNYSCEAQTIDASPCAAQHGFPFHADAQPFAPRRVMSCIATFEVKMTKPATRARARAQSDKLLGRGSSVALLQHRDRPACARRLGRRADELQRRRRLLPLLPTTPAHTQTHTRTCLSTQLLQLDSTQTTYLRAGARSIVGSRACTSTRRMRTSALRFAARSRTYPSGSARSSGRLRHARCRCGGGHVLCAPVAVIYARPPS